MNLANILRKSSAKDTSPHLIVIARAGTGKTTTLVEGLKLLRGEEVSITPSPQQQAIWDEILKSQNAQSVCFVAFNKSIADELKQRVPRSCDAMTMHSMGFKAIREEWGKVQVNEYRTRDIITKILGVDQKELRQQMPNLLKATERLVSLCKMNLNRKGEDEYLLDLASQHDVDLSDDSQTVLNLIRDVLEQCRKNDGSVDFDDMIWIPIILDLPVRRYDLLLVDEAQDLNRCQQQLALKAGRRLILVGDPKQSIYGFAGADGKSMNRMTETFLATERGCNILPLTVSRRCGKAIVTEAQQYVPEFEAHEDNPPGEVFKMLMEDADNIDNDSVVPGEYSRTPTHHTGYRVLAEQGDMILCRTNAPLVSECFKFLKESRKATIRGRDIGQGLVTLIYKVMSKYEGSPNYEDPHMLAEMLSRWLISERLKENNTQNPSEQKLIALQDKKDCLCCFAYTSHTVSEVIQKIESIFTDEKNGVGISLSSIHKAKGLEAKRVFLLLPKESPIPHPMATTPQQRDQETNLLYVAITRAIHELVYVY